MGLKFLAAAGFAAIAVLGGAAAQDSSNRGEQVQNAACLGCHDLRPIETASYDKSGWNDFLVRNHGPLPDGPGKQILLNTCTLCHDLGRVRAHTVSREEWEETLLAMLNEGAMLSDQDFPVLLAYLARNFKP